MVVLPGDAIIFFVLLSVSNPSPVLIDDAALGWRGVHRYRTHGAESDAARKGVVAGAGLRGWAACATGMCPEGKHIPQDPHACCSPLVARPATLRDLFSVRRRSPIHVRSGGLHVSQFSQTHCRAPFGSGVVDRTGGG